MQSLRTSILNFVRIRVSTTDLIARDLNALSRLNGKFCTSASSTQANSDKIMDRVLTLVKKYNSVDASKVTETADFQKDLSLDSLDRTELVMAFEEEFSVEIPDEDADRLKCCADVANYITSGAGKRIAKDS